MTWLMPKTSGELEMLVVASKPIRKSLKCTKMSYSILKRLLIFTKDALMCRLNSNTLRVRLIHYKDQAFVMRKSSTILKLKTILKMPLKELQKVHQKTLPVSSQEIWSGFTKPSLFSTKIITNLISVYNSLKNVLTKQNVPKIKTMKPFAINRLQLSKKRSAEKTLRAQLNTSKSSQSSALKTKIKNSKERHTKCWQTFIVKLAKRLWLFSIFILFQNQR